MKRFRLTIAAAASLVIAAPVVHAQAIARSAVVAAAEYMRTNSDLQDMGPGDLVLDGRVADLTGKLTTSRARAEASAILRALGARRMGTKEQEIACTGPTPRDCRLRPKVKCVVALSAARMDGENASVDVHLWTESGSEDEPVATKHLIVDLERVDGAWRVKGDRPLRIS
jgi:hypothetical protein